jgi:precorrin-8X/cobalt-precorrin-8 methylmutase
VQSKQTVLPASRQIPILAPEAIEPESFRIIEQEMGPHDFSVLEWPVVQRVIHSTADFDLGSSLIFHPRAIEAGIAAIRSGCDVVTDVRMVQAGINAALLEAFGGHVRCFMADPDVVALAKVNGTTRAVQCVRKAAKQAPGAIYAIGNAPTALLELVRLIEDGEASISLVIGVPVGFVAAVESKEQLRAQGLVPYITNHGRKGGTPVAVSIVNALLRIAQGREESAR